MAVSAVPQVVAALFEQATKAFADPTVWDGDEVTVYDGYGNAEDPGSYLMIGVEDPADDAPARSATSQQEWASVGARSRDEKGEVVCVVYAGTGAVGNDAQRQVREEAYAIAEQVASLCRANPSLGVETLLWASYGTDSSLIQLTDDQGVMAALSFRIQFEARI